MPNYIEAKQIEFLRKNPGRRGKGKPKCPFYPTRPKPPVTVWHLFSRDFTAPGQLTNNRSKKSLLQDAKRAFLMLTDAEKREYDTQIQADTTRFNMESTLFKKQVRILQQQPTMYGVFQKVLAQKLHQKGRRLQDFLGQSLKIWRQLPEHDKAPFKERADFRLSLQKELLGKLKGGRALNDIWEAKYGFGIWTSPIVILRTPENLANLGIDKETIDAISSEDDL